MAYKEEEIEFIGGTGVWPDTEEGFNAFYAILIESARLEAKEKL